MEEYLLLSNSHDGSRSIEILYTPVRVVCQNTLSQALGRTGNGRVTFRHFSGVHTRIADAQEILGITAQKHTSLTEAIESMKGDEPTKDEIETVLTNLFLTSEKKTERYFEIERNIKHLFRDGEANVAGGDTTSSWALYNGITEYLDHFRRPGSRSGNADRRLESNWYGSSAEIKSRAFDEVLAII